MRTSLKQLAPALAALALSVSAAAAQSSVPTLNVRTTCTPLANNDFSMQIDTESCLKTEQQARQKLTEVWTQYSASDRSMCTQTARMGGIESYVQLLTCLELQEDARRERSRADPRMTIDGQTAPTMRERPVNLPPKR